MRSGAKREHLLGLETFLDASPCCGMRLMSTASSPIAHGGATLRTMSSNPGACGVPILQAGPFLMSRTVRRIGFC